jgi:hypothetical protein
LGDREINKVSFMSWRCNGKVTDDRGCDWVSIRGLCKIYEGLGKDLLKIYQVHLIGMFFIVLGYQESRNSDRAKELHLEVVGEFLLEAEVLSEVR